MMAQLRQLLEREGCEEVFSEQVSSVEHRGQLDAALRMLRRGDTLVITRLDRFARSLGHALCLENKITERGANLKILDPNIDTATPRQHSQCERLRPSRGPNSPTTIAAKSGATGTRR